jgi:YbgC/YbaW family acyl-CoA thioester hydrolase
VVFKRSFRVHWVDTDIAGVMHFSNFFRYFEACEEEFYRSLSLPLTEIRDRFGLMLPRVDAHCQYKAACRFDEPIDVTLKVREVEERGHQLRFPDSPSIRRKTRGGRLREMHCSKFRMEGYTIARRSRKYG